VVGGALLFFLSHCFFFFFGSHKYSKPLFFLLCVNDMALLWLTALVDPVDAVPAVGTCEEGLFFGGCVALLLGGVCQNKLAQQ
jgi:hypothetical protein